VRSASSSGRNCVFAMHQSFFLELFPVCIQQSDLLKRGVRNFYAHLQGGLLSVAITLKIPITSGGLDPSLCRGSAKMAYGRFDSIRSTYPSGIISKTS
jgi:hypothetical protein